MFEITPFAISVAGGIAYSFLFMQAQKIQMLAEKSIFRIVITSGRMLFLGFFLYILLKYWPTHSILIVSSFLVSFITTTIVSQKS